MDLVKAEQALAERRLTLFQLRLQKERGEVKNNRQFPQVKKEIARLVEHISVLNHVAMSEADEETPEETATADEDGEDE
jgi:large subunit ribosomal protein L29